MGRLQLQSIGKSLVRTFDSRSEWNCVRRERLSSRLINFVSPRLQKPLIEHSVSRARRYPTNNDAVELEGELGIGCGGD